MGFKLTNMISIFGYNIRLKRFVLCENPSLNVGTYNRLDWGQNVFQHCLFSIRTVMMWFCEDSPEKLGSSIFTPVKTFADETKVYKYPLTRSGVLGTDLNRVAPHWCDRRMLPLNWASAA